MAEIFNLPTKEQFDTMNANLANIANPASSNVNYINTTSGLLATNVQSAIDEIDEQVNTNKTDILSAKTTLGSVAMTTTAQTVTGAINELDADVGNKSTLITTNKTNLVNAVNENREQINSLDAEVVLKANKEQEAWIAPTLLNGWVDFDSLRNFRYFKDNFGVVHFSGSIKSGTVTNATSLFFLPLGYRPQKIAYFIVSNGGSVFANITVGNDGNVTLYSDSVSSAILSLDNISFKAV